MKNVRMILFTAISLIGFNVFTSCNDSTDDNNAAGTSRMRVTMTDAPGDYDEVNVEVLDVKIKGTTDAGEQGWVSIGNITPGIYDLLDLTGGVTVLLADNDVSSGNLGQIRLILGDQNTVVKDGVTYPLNTPSAQQSGLKIHVNQPLLDGIEYNFLLDFDVNNSIVIEAGNSGNYNLHPVIRVTSEAVSGSITGSVPISAGQVLATVMVGSETISSYSNSEGVFYLHGLPSGTYTVTITTNPVLGLVTTIDNIAVVNGQVNNIGTVSI
ncbi:MAG TPA: DUF4382 domain-containing protein [Flavobacterium sp.]|jgi:hypothetical protein